MSGTSSSLTTFGNEEAAVFEQARDRFIQNLSEEDRVAFIGINSSAELLNEFKRFRNFFEDDSRWTKVLSVVKDCSYRLQPYFDIVGIITQSHPEWTAIAWGAFRLALQAWLIDASKAGSNFVGFFEKLAEILSEVASFIPAYSDILHRDISHPSDCFRMSLSKFYEDLLEFFQAFTRLFAQKSCSEDIESAGLSPRLTLF